MKILREPLRETISPPHSTLATVRAVIVNYNGAELTALCVQSLLSQDAACEVEIVVVDNHSPDSDWHLLQQLMAEYPVKLHRCATNLGYAGGINAGARLPAERAPDYILVLNSDITLSRPDAVGCLVKALQDDPRRVACSPLIRDRDNPAPPETASQVRRLPGYWMTLVVHSCWLRRTGFGRRLSRDYLYEDLRPFPLETTLDCETINGACFLLDQRFLEEIGYLDQRTFLYMEELTLGASIRARGSTACLCTSVVADHIQGASTGLRGHSRPLRRELQQVYSELVYLRFYTDTGWAQQGLFLLVRAMDLTIKAPARLMWRSRT